MIATRSRPFPAALAGQAASAANPTAPLIASRRVNDVSGTTHVYQTSVWSANRDAHGSASSASRTRFPPALGSATEADSEEAIDMGEVAGRRMTAEIDGDFVVFLIGARFNNKLQIARSLLDLGARRGMKHMLDYLVAPPREGSSRVRVRAPDDRPVLAVIRSPGVLRQGQGRSSLGRVASVLATGREKHPHGDLA